MIHWLTTRSNPRSTSWRAFPHPDAGQRGWRLHAVEAKSANDTFKDIYHTRALCGLRAKHGWGLDTYVTEKCERCLKKVKEK